MGRTDSAIQMNTPAVTPSNAAHAGQPAASSIANMDDDDIHLMEYLDILIDHKWLVAAVAAL